MARRLSEQHTVAGRRKSGELDASGQPQPQPHEHFPGQQRLREIYASNGVQWFVALVIIGNFVVTLAEAELDPYPNAPELQQHRSTWVACDIAFNVIFTVEVLVNMAGSWFLPFWRSPWNVFDFVVVLVSLLGSAGALEGPLRDLKMLRAFRIFRIFKRIASLSQIVVAILHSIPGVIEAFVLMLIVMCVYAVLAVDYLKSFGKDGTYVTEQYCTQLADCPQAAACGHTVTRGIPESALGSVCTDDDGLPLLIEHNASSVTLRMMVHGEEYYGSFSRALFSLLQVLTGESWAENVARPNLFGVNPRNALGSGAFYTSFILLMQIVFMNVVVAVLLDKFQLNPVDSEESEDGEAPRSLGEEVALLNEEIAQVTSQLAEEASGLKGSLHLLRVRLGRMDGDAGGADAGLGTGVARATPQRKSPDPELRRNPLASAQRAPKPRAPHVV